MKSTYDAAPSSSDFNAPAVPAAADALDVDEEELVELDADEDPTRVNAVATWIEDGSEDKVNAAMDVDEALVVGLVEDVVEVVGCAVDVLVETTGGDDGCTEEELGLGAAVVGGGSDEEVGGVDAAGVFEVVGALLAVEDVGGVPVTRIVPFCITQAAKDQNNDSNDTRESTYDSGYHDGGPRGCRRGARRRARW